MSTIFTLFMILIMIACVLVIIIIMAQNPKGGGLSSAFGGTSSAQFGIQRTNEFMEKSTWTLGATIVVLCILSVVLTAKPDITTSSTPTKTEQVKKTSEDNKTKSMTTDSQKTNK